MEISDEDLSILRAFVLKIKSCMPTRTYSMLAHAFPKEPPPSLAHACTHVSALSGVKPTLFDCCINSCCCYISPYINDQNCSFCNEPRFDSWGRTCSQFTYVPLLPQLVALYRNPRMAEQMCYCASCEYEPDWMSDIFDGHIYRDLCHTKIEVDGQQLPCNYFSDPHDIALRLSTDGFAPFRRQKTTAVSQSVDLGQSQRNNPNTTPTKDDENVRVVVYLHGVQRGYAEEGERGSTPTG